jgi:hypothetical protein
MRLTTFWPLCKSVLTNKCMAISCADFGVDARHMNERRYNPGLPVLGPLEEQRMSSHVWVIGRKPIKNEIPL